jgi:hypothetical protein
MVSSRVISVQGTVGIQSLGHALCLSFHSLVIMHSKEHACSNKKKKKRHADHCKASEELARKLLGRIWDNAWLLSGLSIEKTQWHRDNAWLLRFRTSHI